MRAVRSALQPRVWIVLAGIVISGVAGYMAGSHKKIPLLAGGGLLIIGIIALDPMLLAILTFPATLFPQRLGGSSSGSNLGMSDVVLVLSLAISLTVVSLAKAPTLRLFLGLTAIYEGTALLSVLFNPNSHDALEWVHRLIIVGGGMVTGWMVTASGRQRQALTIYLVGAGVLALATLEHSLALHFQPAQWGSYQKNYIGTVMWTTVMIAQIDPPWARLSRRVTVPVKYLCLLGLLASQSKQATIALSVALLLAVVLDSDVRRKSIGLLLAALPVIVIAYVVSTNELSAAHSTINSASIRTAAFESDWKVWHLDPLFGLGPRWYYLPQYSGYLQPPNVLIESLTDTGLIGTIGLAILFFGTAWALFKLPRSIGILALSVMVGRVTQSAFDLYWAAAEITLSWLLVGLAAGLADSRVVEPPATARMSRGLVK